MFKGINKRSMSKKQYSVVKACSVLLGMVPFMIKAHEYVATLSRGGGRAWARPRPIQDFTMRCSPLSCGNAETVAPGSVEDWPSCRATTGTYTPGVAMQILVTITDSTKAAYGFELTARSGTGNLTQAGDFTFGSDGYTQVVCADDSNKDNGKACPSLFPIQYIEHTLAGFNASQRATPKGSFSYTMQWTPPATAVGPVTLYVAGNAGLAGPGDGHSNRHSLGQYCVAQPGAATTNA